MNARQPPAARPADPHQGTSGTTRRRPTLWITCFAILGLLGVFCLLFLKPYLEVRRTVLPLEVPASALLALVRSMPTLAPVGDDGGRGFR